jgi:gliding motility-associated-like protein
LDVTSANGCTDSASEIICIDPDVSIYVPNTFTPNEDGVNEVFIPVTTGINPDKYEFWVFDRWGNLIFYTDDLNEGWNGRVQGHDKLCQIDTYVWKVKCVDVLDKKHNLIGHVNLIR